MSDRRQKRRVAISKEKRHENVQCDHCHWEGERHQLVAHLQHSHRMKHHQAVDAAGMNPKQPAASH